MPKTLQRRPKDHENSDCEQQLRLMTEFIIRALEKHGITAFAWDRAELPALQMPRAPFTRVN